MSLTAQDVVTRIREQIADEVDDPTDGYRWEDDVLFRLITDFTRWLRRKRPEAFYTEAASVTRPTITAVTALGNTLQFSEGEESTCVDWVSRRIQLQDSEDANALTISREHEAETEKEV